VAKPRERGVTAHLAPRSRGFAARLVASPLASRILRIKPKREPARRLSGRKQATDVNGKLSSFQLLNHGVPQGSVLAPLLFLIFINDLPVGVIGQNTTVDIFADDTSMSSSVPISNIHTLRSNLNTSFQQLDNWSANNRVRLNTDKTKSMLIANERLRNKLTEDEKLLNIKLKISTLQQVSTYIYKSLGITIDHELTFDDHVDSLCGKLAQPFFLKMKEFYFTTPPSKLSLCMVALFGEV